MKRGRLLIACAMVIVAPSLLQTSRAIEPAAVQWQTDLNKAQESSKAKKRHILLFVTSDECLYCHKMNRDTYGHPSVADAIHENFIAAVVNASVHPNWVRQARISSFPMTMIVTSEGKVLDTLNGYADPTKMHRWLSQNSGKDTAARDVPTVDR